MITSARDMGSSSDPREFVFAMLPIATPSERIKIAGCRKEVLPVADYGKSTEQVFREAARYVIHELQDVLPWWDECPPCARPLQGLPSWVPDFSSRNEKNNVKISTETGCAGGAIRFQVESESRSTMTMF